LHKGLQQLGEEGAVQVFKPVTGGDLILGAVGVLQFEVVASRLLNEAADAVFEGTSISSARWITTTRRNWPISRSPRPAPTWPSMRPATWPTWPAFVNPCA
jgi:peptide subunit release factor RF-3